MGDVRVISLAAVRGFAREKNQSEAQSGLDRTTERSRGANRAFRQSTVKNNVIGKQLDDPFPCSKWITLYLALLRMRMLH